MKFQKVDRVYVNVSGVKDNLRHAEIQTGVYMFHFDEPLGGERHQAQHYIGSSFGQIQARLSTQMKGKSRAGKILQACHKRDIPVRVARVWVVPETVDERWKLHRYEYELKYRKMGARYCPICNPQLGGVTMFGDVLQELAPEDIQNLINIPF